MADGATIEAGRASPAEEDLAEAAVTKAGADKPSVGPDAASVGVDTASVEVAVASEEADTGEAEAVMAVGAGSFRHEVETLAAEGICSRPLCFRSSIAHQS